MKQHLLTDQEEVDLLDEGQRLADAQLLERLVCTNDASELHFVELLVDMGWTQQDAIAALGNIT